MPTTCMGCLVFSSHKNSESTMLSARIIQVPLTKITQIFRDNNLVCRPQILCLTPLSISQIKRQPLI